MILLLDNYDSFTYNIFQIVAEKYSDTLVYRNDEINIQKINELNPDKIIISPGPSHPKNSGICQQVIEQFGHSTPILGVCLGHQVIGHTYGSIIEKAPSIFHGKTSLIEHNDNQLFNGVPTPFNAMRYHSLIINEKSLNKDFDKIAWTNEGIIMGISHKKFPIYGIQFHPESIGTEYGEKILLNFLNI
tara:strand:+ start:16677 stop:17240 length:564 start_codon:yes stop_codon:yes gene_type:complete